METIESSERIRFRRSQESVLARLGSTVSIFVSQFQSQSISCDTGALVVCMTCSAAGDEEESYLRRPCCSNSSFGPILSCFFRSPLRSPLLLSLGKQSKSLLLSTRKDGSWQSRIENEPIENDVN